MKRVTLGCLVVVASAAATALPPCATASPTRPAAPVLRAWTTITGSSGYAVVTLKRTIRWQSHYRFVARAPNRPSEMRSTATDLAAVELRPDDWHGDRTKTPSVGIMKLPAVAGGGAIYRLALVTVPPGRYRLYVVASRRTAVTFHLPGQPPGRLSVTASHPAHAVIRRWSFPPVAAGLDTPYRSMELGFDVRRLGLVMSAIWERGRAASRVFQGCLYEGDPPGGEALPGCPGASDGLTFEDPTQAPGQPSSLVGGYADGYPAGRWTAADQTVTAGEVRDAGGQILWLDYSCPHCRG